MHAYKSQIPQMGLGTWRLNGQECIDTVQLALELGYRHIDTADVYDNHREIAKAIRSWPRQELFLTTKIFTQDLDPDRAREATFRFLDELQVAYLDLLLIHWPTADANLVETLTAMNELKEQGVTRLIGVSNFVRSHLELIEPYHFPIATNQIELHPYLQRRLVADTCQKMGIHITAYRPLAQGAFEEDPVMQQIGKKHQKTPSQIALRWLVQKGYAVIPKAANVQHLKDNLHIFDFSLEKEDVKKIDDLDAGRRFCAPSGLQIFED
jgi:2,5-diketo-D-gluconate reductase B